MRRRPLLLLKIRRLLLLPLQTHWPPLQSLLRSLLLLLLLLLVLLLQQAL